MLARRLAIGVRSSWLASATRWRCDTTERSSASSVELKLRARRVSSSRPVTSMRSDGSGSAASSSVRRVKLAIGASAVRATTAPIPTPRATPAAPTNSSTSRMRSSWRSTSSSGRATWIAPASPRPRGEDAQVEAGDGRVDQLLARAIASDGVRALVQRQRVAGGRAAQQPAVRQHELDVALGAAERLRAARRASSVGRSRAASEAATASARSCSEASTSSRSSPRTPR